MAAFARSKLSLSPRENAPREAPSTSVPWGRPGGPGAGSSAGSGTYARAAVARVLRVPDALLATRARPVDPQDPEVIALANVLTVTMQASPACVGLAATQIGASMHLFAMDVTGHRKARSCAGLVVLANAYIVSRRGEVVQREGCLSVPDLTGNVMRAEEVEVEGHEPESGRLIRIRADGIEARCLQHELDHLDGLVFVDRITDAARDLFPRKTYA